MILTWHTRSEDNRRYKAMSLSERDILQCLVRDITRPGDALGMMSFDLPDHTELVGIYRNEMMASWNVVLFNPAWPIIAQGQLPEHILANHECVMVNQRLENPDPGTIIARIMAMRNAPAPTEKDPSFDVINIPDPWNPGNSFAIRRNQYIHMLNGAGITTPIGFFTAEEIRDKFLMTPFSLDDIPPFDRGEFRIEHSGQLKGIFQNSVEGIHGREVAGTTFSKPLTFRNDEQLRLCGGVAQILNAAGIVKDQATYEDFFNPALGEPKEKTEEPKRSWRDDASMLGGISGG